VITIFCPEKGKYMTNIKESGLAEVVRNDRNSEISNPLQETLKRVFYEIPVIPERVEVEFALKVEADRSLGNPSILAEFKSFMQNGIFKLRDNVEVRYGPKYEDNKEQYLKNVQDTNKRVMNGSKPDFVRYSGDGLGFETLKNTELNSVIEAGYKMESFRFDLSFRNGYPVSRLVFNGRRLELDVQESDDNLSKDDKKKIKKWFETLKEPQQK
jgi:hypothetical protein